MIVYYFPLVLAARHDDRDFPETHRRHHRAHPCVRDNVILGLQQLFKFRACDEVDGLGEAQRAGSCSRLDEGAQSRLLRCLIDHFEETVELLRGVTDRGEYRIWFLHIGQPDSSRADTAIDKQTGWRGGIA